MQRITMAAAAILSCALAACGDVSTTSPDAAPAPVTLTVTTVGAGRVTSAPADIDCGTACSDDFAVGTAITLTGPDDRGDRDRDRHAGDNPAHGPMVAEPPRAAHHPAVMIRSHRRAARSDKASKQRTGFCSTLRT
jgi:hypothetical protein